MKMSIIEMEYKNIRKIKDLKLQFVREDGSVIKNNFVMMANGTGKTTTMTLLKGLFDKSAENWSVEQVRSFAPTAVKADDGIFSITVKFDERRYKYFLILNYKAGFVEIKTSVPPKGYEKGLRLPEAIRGIFSTEFIRRFVFDGEQVAELMNSSSNEAEETIKYLYRLDTLDDIIALNKKMLIEVQNAEGEKGSGASLSNLRTRQEKVNKAKTALIKQKNDLKDNIEDYEKRKRELETQREQIDKEYVQLSQEKKDIEIAQAENRTLIETQIANIIGLIKSPYLLSEEICNRLQELGNSMTKLKLPRAISKDFFTELANTTTCVCDRCIGVQERQAILKNAERYLGSDQQTILNVIKSSLVRSAYDSRLDDAFELLRQLRDRANSLDIRYANNEEDLLQAGGKEAEDLHTQIDRVKECLIRCRAEVEKLESRDEDDPKLTCENNIHRAEKEYERYSQLIAAATRTNNALQKKRIIESVILEIKRQATRQLKEEIVRKANEKLKRVIVDDDIEIESIDQYIKLNGRDGASEGQALGIAYCFLGTLFEDAELEFPFIIDSPTGKMDFEKRQAVAEIIPALFNQLIAFVQSAEVERFADQFYDKNDVQYLTIIASPHGETTIHKGSDFFDSYQREHKGDEE